MKFSSSRWISEKKKSRAALTKNEATITSTTGEKMEMETKTKNRLRSRKSANINKKTSCE